MKPSLIFSILFIAGIIGSGTSEAASSRGKKTLAEAYDLPVPAKLTAFKHPVIYASPEVYAKRVNGKTVVRQTLIIKWGIHVYEVAEGLYQCEGTATKGYQCEWVDHDRLATYSSCDVSEVDAGAKPKCTGLIAGNSGPSENVNAGWDPDAERYVPNEWSEYPDRHHDPENPIP